MRRTRNGGTKPTPDPCSLLGQRKAEDRLYETPGPSSRPVWSAGGAASYLFGRQGEGAHVGTWRAS